MNKHKLKQKKGKQPSISEIVVISLIFIIIGAAFLLDTTTNKSLEKNCGSLKETCEYYRCEATFYEHKVSIATTKDFMNAYRECKFMTEEEDET